VIASSSRWAPRIKIINRVLRGHGDVHWRPTFSRDAIAPHERYQTWFSRISCRGKPRSPQLARGRCVVYLREILDGIADCQAAQDRQFRGDSQLRADDLGIP